MISASSLPRRVWSIRLLAFLLQKKRRENEPYGLKDGIFRLLAGLENNDNVRRCFPRFLQHSIKLLKCLWSFQSCFLRSKGLLLYSSSEVEPGRLMGTGCVVTEYPSWLMPLSLALLGSHFAHCLTNAATGTIMPKILAIQPISSLNKASKRDQRPKL